MTARSHEVLQKGKALPMQLKDRSITCRLHQRLDPGGDCMIAIVTAVWGMLSGRWPRWRARGRHQAAGMKMVQVEREAASSSCTFHCHGRGGHRNLHGPAYSR